MILFSSQPDWLPIMRQVQDAGILIMHNQFAGILNSAEIKFKQLGEYNNQEVFGRSTQEAARLVANLYSSELDATKLTGKPQQLANGKFLASYAYPRLLDIVNVIATLDVAKPKLIVLHNDVEPINRALALWALYRRVPCLHVPHAIYLDTEGRGPAGTDVHDLITASLIACAGPYQRDWYIERGAYPNTTFITGLPQFDRLANPKPDHKRAAHLLGLDAQRPVVVYKSSWRQDTNIAGCHDGVEETYQAFLAMAKTLPDLQYLVSCHPHGNNLQWHIQEAEKANVNCVVTQEHLDVILNACDIMLCYGPSNVMLEAATLNNSYLVCVNDTGAFPNDSEIIKCAADPAQMANIVRSCLANSALPDYTNFVYKYLGPQDGKATERIISLIQGVHK